MKRIKEVNLVFLITVISSLIIPELLMLFIKDILTLQIISTFVLALPAIIYLIINKINIIEHIRIKKVGIANIVLLILFSYLIMPLLSLLNLISMLFVENHISNTVSNMLSDKPLIVGLLTFALLPAIFEEGVYRGFFYNEYSKTNILKAMLLSGLMFGLLHMNFNQMLYAIVMGIIFVLIVEATDSIISSIIIHFIINAHSVVITYLMPYLQKFLNTIYGEQASRDMLNAETITRQDILTSLMAVAFSAIVATTLAIITFITIAKNCDRYNHIKNIFNLKDINLKNKEGLLDLALIIGLLVCVGMSIYIEIASSV